MIDRQVSARSNPSGRSTGTVGDLHRTDPAEPERPQARLGPGDQVPDRGLGDQPERMHHPLALRPLPPRVAEPDLHAVHHGLLQDLEVGRGRSRASGPSWLWSSTTADAAASASARNGSGSARTSLRRAALTSGVADAEGPATRNSARASAAVRPAEVRPGPADQRPAAAPSRPASTPGSRPSAKASRSRRAVRSEISSSAATSAAVTRARGAAGAAGRRPDDRLAPGEDATQTGQGMATSMGQNGASAGCTQARDTRHRRGIAVASAIETEGLVKTFGKVRALDGIDMVAPGGHRVRAARAQRRRQDHGHPGAVHPAPPRRGAGQGGRVRRGDAARGRSGG